MRRHAKASSAGSSTRQANRLGRIFRGAFAMRGASSDADGSSAPSAGPGRKGLLIGALALALAVAVVAQAFGAKGVVKSIGTSSPGVTGGLFNFPKGVAVNTSGNGAPAGTLYVVDTENNRVQRFDASGNFVSAFGKDVQGAGINLCTTPASCTKGAAAATAGAFGSGAAQGIAVEQSTGNLYVTDQVNRRVDVFSATGTFEGAFGWKVNATTPEEKLQLCTTATGCQVGSTGSGAGQFGSQIGYPAVDQSSGKVYVANKTSRRVDEFEPTLTAGEVTGIAFVRGYGWGAETGAAEFQVCTTTCVAPATTGSAQGQFSFSAPSELGVDNSGNVYALDANNNRVQKFSSTGSPLDSSFASANLGTSPAPVDLYVNPAASGHVFVEKSNGTEVRTLELSTAGALLETHGFGTGLFSTRGVALDSGNGNIYVTSENRVLVLNTPLVPPSATIDPVTTFTGHTAQLTGSVNPNDGGTLETSYRFEISSDEITWTKVPASPVSVGSGTSAVPVSQEATGLSANTLYQVRLVAGKPFGAGSATASTSFTTTAIAPDAEAFASEVEREEAELGAEINPNGSATTYQFEYVDDAHYQPLEANPYAEGGVAPAAPASVGSGTSTVTVHRRIEGLSPATVYHYRVVAVNGAGTTSSPDHEITTWPASRGAEAPCANQQLRTGPAAELPDCRAYEMVSPLDKGGAGIIPGPTGAASVYRAAYEQAAVDGDAITYTSATAFGDEPSNRNANQYISRRGAAGWSTHGISSPLGGTVLAGLGPASPWAWDSPFFWFSDDLSSAWLFDHNDPPLLPAAQQGFANLYRRDNLDDTYHDPVLTSEPLVAPSGPDYGPVLGGLSFRGRSQDGSHVVIEAQAQLTADAAPIASNQIYDYSGGELHVVSVLPNGEPTGNANVATSTSSPNTHGRARANTERGVSSDGSRVFWTKSTNFEQLGKVYVRVDGTTTVPVSESVTTLASQFLTASTDGATAIFSFDPTSSTTADLDDLYEFDVDTEAPTLIAHEEAAFLGASEDLSRLYFVSREALAAGATAGEENLYLREGGSERFIATVPASDVFFGGGSYDRPTLSGRNFAPAIGSIAGRLHAVRVSPDGGHLLFMSSGSLTGYDNADAQSGEADMEVFLYDAGADQLACVSCNPSGARPRGGYTKPEFYRGSPEVRNTPEQIPTEWRTAAWFPTAEQEHHAPQVLSDDGSRVFFHARDALLPEDTNNQQDVYEWEAPGSGSCEVGGPRYFALNEGCVTLISTGKSSTYSQFVDATPDGSDVFIRTESSIDPRDLGLMDIYDARVGGGLPLPTGIAACEGEACQSPPPEPNDPTPGSSSYNGPGNVSEAPAAKKKHKKKHHKRRHAHKRHRANHNRRAAR